MISLDAIVKMYDKLDVPKAMARKLDCEHNDTDSAADGYVTAWFMWQLQGDEYAARAFIGDDSELLQDGLYQDQRIDLE